MERTYHYRIDREGHIWHDGTEIIDPRFLSLVHRKMQHTPSGLLVRCQGENCLFEAEDVPYVIQDIAFHKTEQGRLFRVDLIFPGGFTEILNPATLWVGAGNVLYCKVRERAFDARFSRKAFFQLAPLLGEKETSYFLELNGKSYPIHHAPDSTEVRRQV